MTRGRALVFGAALVAARLLTGEVARADDPIPAAAVSPDPGLEPVRLGPTCAVHYQESIQAMTHAVAPALMSLSRAELSATTHAWEDMRFPSGLVPHAGPPATAETDLAKHLPAGTPLPPTLETMDLIFVRPGDRASDRLLDALRSRRSAQPTPARALVAFLVDVTGAEFQEARTSLAATVRAAFPTSPNWARFLGVTSYPALVRVQGGIAHTIAGDLTAADLEAHGF